MSGVQGRVAVVTGAFGALGSAVARKFRAAGVTVASIGRAPASAALAAEFTAPHVLLSSVDLTSIEEAGKAITAVAARSEERRVGKEWRAGWAREHKKKKKENEE